MTPWEREWSAPTGEKAAPINMSREGGWTDRALAGLKMTEQGGVNFLKSKYGDRNVATASDGNVFIRDTDKGEWYPFDSDKLGWKDLADVSGEAVQMLPIMRATRMGTAAVAALAGNAGRQGLSALMPGDDEMTASDRASSAGIDAALGGAAQGVVNVGARVFDALRPRNVGARYVQRALDTPAGREGAQVEAYLGEQMMPGQASQSRSLLTMEGLLRRHPASADMIASKDESLLRAARARLDNALSRMSATGDRATAGMRVRSAFDNTLNAALDVRRNQAAQDFGAVHAAAGRAPIFHMGGAVRAIDGLIEEFGTPGAGDAISTLVNQLRSVRNELSRPLTAQNVQRLLEIYGRARRGSGQVFKDLDNAEQRRIAGLVFDAIEGDLDRVAQSLPPGNVATSLQQARNNYRLNSQAINELEASTLGRYLGGADRSPERIFEQMKNMQPSQAGETFRILQGADPGLADAVKRSVFEDALERAKPPAQRVEDQLTAGANPEGDWSPARFLSNLRGSWVWGQLNRNERFEFQMLASAMQRLANRAGTDGSPTAPLLFALDVAKSMGKSVVGLDPVGMAQMGTAALAPRVLAPLVATSRGRQALVTVMNTRPQTKAYQTAALTLVALMSKPSEAADAPSGELDDALSQTRATQSPPWQRSWKR